MDRLLQLGGSPTSRVLRIETLVNASGLGLRDASECVCEGGEENKACSRMAETVSVHYSAGDSGQK